MHGLQLVYASTNMTCPGVPLTYSITAVLCTGLVTQAVAIAGAEDMQVGQQRNGWNGACLPGTCPRLDYWPGALHV